MQVVSIELQQQILYCPVTGTLISDGENESTPSPALLFIYLHEVDEFEYMRPDIEEMFENIMDSLDDEDEEQMSPYDILINNELKDSKTYLLMSLTYCGIACGPVSSTVDYCFDMNYSPE